MVLTWCYLLGWAMDYLDYMLAKAAVMIALAFVWGVFCGFTGRNLRGQRQGRSGADTPER